MSRRISLCVCFLLVMSATLALATGTTEAKVTLRATGIPEAMGNVEGGAFMAALKAKFPEVTIVWEPILYSAYPEKMPVLMASGDLPDILQANVQAYLPQLVAGNLVAPLDEALKKYGKDIVANQRDGQLAFGQFSGKQYAIPNQYLLKYFAQMIRMDWLDKLGLKVPVTMDEFREVARAFTLKDPDGNGKQDTYGTSFRQNVNFIDSFFHAYGVAPGHHQAGMWRIRNGKHTNDWVQPQMKEALLNLASWYKEGLIAPESLTYDWPNWWAQYLQNRIGMWYHQPARLPEMNATLKKAGIENAKMWPIDPPKGPYGQGSTNEGQPWGTFFTAKNLNKAVEVFNYSYTQEFYLASKGTGGYSLAPKAALGENGWPVFYTAQEMATDPNYETRRKEVMYSQVWTSFSLENPNQAKNWANRALAANVLQQYKNTQGAETTAGNALADKWAVTTSKTVPVPADSKYFVGLQTKFRETASKIVSGQNADQVWNDWLAFYAANGGPEIEADVNKLIPIK
jgi:ABC-type glycerol-3-phosphate transport system substrate-binding protein